MARSISIIAKLSINLRIRITSNHRSYHNESKGSGARSKRASISNKTDEETYTHKISHL